MTEQENELTFGMKAVGVTFNPSNMPEVDRCKMQFANCIDQMHALRTATENTKPSAERARLASLAITAAQEAQMWAVKALTWND